MIYLPDLRDVFRSTLKVLDKADPDQWSLAAEQLMVATPVSESLINGNMHLVQQGNGPALGICQVEPRTHASIWDSRLRYRPELKAAVEAISRRNVKALTYNLAYSCAIARQVYRRAPASLPAAGDAVAMGRYWKRWYNTAGGAGSANEFAARFSEFVLPLYEDV